jgi:hypothetical protein
LSCWEIWPTVSGTGLSFSPPCFHVHGGGPIVGLLVNEFGIACTVTTAIRESPDLPLPAEIRRTGDRAEARRDKERGQQLNTPNRQICIWLAPRAVAALSRTKSLGSLMPGNASRTA